MPRNFDSLIEIVEQNGEFSSQAINFCHAYLSNNHDVLPYAREAYFGLVGFQKLDFQTRQQVDALFKAIKKRVDEADAERKKKETDRMKESARQDALDFMNKYALINGGIPLQDYHLDSGNFQTNDAFMRLSKFAKEAMKLITYENTEKFKAKVDDLIQKINSAETIEQLFALKQEMNALNKETFDNHVGSLSSNLQNIYDAKQTKLQSN